MGDIFNGEVFMAKYFSHNVDGNLVLSFQNAISVMANLLNDAEKDPDSIVSNYVDENFQILFDECQREGNLNTMLVVQTFSREIQEFDPLNHFPMLTGGTRVSVTSILKCLGDLMQITMGGADAPHSEESLKVMLRDTWGMGESAQVVFDMKAKAQIKIRNALLIDLYRLTILRWFQLKYGDHHFEGESDDDEGDERAGGTLEEQAEAIRVSNALLQEELRLIGVRSQEASAERSRLAVIAAALKEHEAEEARRVLAAAPVSNLQYDMLAKQIAELSLVVASVVKEIRSPSGKSSFTTPRVVKPSTSAQRDREALMEDSEGDSEDEDLLDFEEVGNARKATAKGLDNVSGAKSGAGELESDDAVCEDSKGTKRLWLYTDVPVPAVAVFKGPASRLMSWQRCDTMTPAVQASCSIWLGSREVSLDVIESAIQSKHGLILLSVTGVPHTHAMPARSKCDPVLRTLIFNPSVNGTVDSYLASIEVLGVSPHLFPCTYGFWKKLMREQFGRVFETLFIKFPAPASEVLQHLMQYKDLFDAKVKVHLFCRGRYQKEQENPAHITIWSVLLLFHLSVWMKALVRRDTSLLVSRFNDEWKEHFENKFVEGELPEVLLKTALRICEYRHEACNIRGTCELYCTKCSLDVNSGSGVKAGGKPPQSAADKRWYEDCKKWQAKKENVNKTMGDFATDSGRPKPKEPSKVPKNASAVSVSEGGSGVEAYRKQQHLIALHAVSR